MMSEEGELTDWKQKFKLKKFESVKLTAKILDFQNQVEALQTEVSTKNQTINDLLEMGLTEEYHKDAKKLSVSELKSKFEQIVSFHPPILTPSKHITI